MAIENNIFLPFLYNQTGQNLVSSIVFYLFSSIVFYQYKGPPPVFLNIVDYSINEKYWAKVGIY